MKKYKIKVLLFSLIVGILIVNIKASATLPLAGKLIIIDPGHGGVDPGTIDGDVLEKGLNLEISLILEKILSEKGASVILTRYEDYDLSKPNAIWRKKSDFDNRIKMINESKADMYISIHMNHLPQEKYYGAQVFYLNENDANKNIAKKIQDVINIELNFDRESKAIPNETYMYPKLKIPGVLIECGFLSNDEEKIKLQKKEYQYELVRVIVEGVVKSFL